MQQTSRKQSPLTEPKLHYMYKLKQTSQRNLKAAWSPPNNVWLHFSTQNEQEGPEMKAHNNDSSFVTFSLLCVFNGLKQLLSLSESLV